MQRTIIVTGASSGIGLAAAEQLAAQGDHVVVVGRNPERLAHAVTRVRAAGQGREPGSFRADFEDLSAVRDLAARLLDAYPKIDVLANNAGAMLGSYRQTGDGYEATMQGNHLAPFLLTGLLRERLSGARVVNTAARAHQLGRPGPFDFTCAQEGFNPLRAYAASKAATILFTVEATRRWPDITSVSFHPGTVRTNLGVGRVPRFLAKFAPGMARPAEAAAQLVWLATAPQAELVGGAYYVGGRVTAPAAHVTDLRAATVLWDASVHATSGQATSGAAQQSGSW